MKKSIWILITTVALLSSCALDQVDVGSAPGAGDGDTLRTAFQKINTAIATIDTNVLRIDTLQLLKIDSVFNANTNEWLANLDTIVAYSYRFEMDTITLGDSTITEMYQGVIPDTTWVGERVDAGGGGSVDADTVVSDSIIFNYHIGALTDATPTETEINAILGTPSSKEAGFTARIKDNTGTLLIYYLVTDGTAWYYIALTEAL